MDTLDQLAALTGIEPGYHDIWGRYRETSRDTKVCFLEALGYPASTEEACAESLHRFETRTWRRLVDPVIVVSAEAQPATVALTVPAEAADRALSWTLTEEGGREHASRIACRLLPVTEMRRVEAGDRVVVAEHAPPGHALTALARPKWRPTRASRRRGVERPSTRSTRPPSASAELSMARATSSSRAIQRSKAPSPESRSR